MTTAIGAVLESGEYRKYQNFLGYDLKCDEKDTDPANSRRFLMRIIVRAILDVCMYPETNEHHISAKSWLLGEHEAAISFNELFSLVGMEDLLGDIVALAKDEGMHRSRVRELKKQLYRLVEDVGTGSNS